MAHPSVQAGTPIYTWGWGSLAPFPVAERGLGIYLWGWFGGQPDTTDAPDEVSFVCDIALSRALELPVAREIERTLPVSQEEIIQVGLGREPESQVSLGREVSTGVER